MVLSDSCPGGASVEELELKGFVKVIAPEAKLITDKGARGAAVNKEQSCGGVWEWLIMVSEFLEKVSATGGIPGGPGHHVFAAIFPVTLVNLGNKHLVPIIGGLLGCKAKDILDPLRQGTMEGKLESIVFPAGLIGFPFKLYNKGHEAFIVMHSEVEEIFLHLHYGVKDAELTREFLGESKPIGEHKVVGVKSE
ncbi:hypothetical protein E4T56_gene5217 [Termitomyces sp. T112]|nr:hypothetical protein E4T56_gene5217 [Termitomyces sp. T112]